MSTIRRCCFRMLFAIVAALSISFTTLAAYAQENILVGRIAHVDGKLLRYVDEGKDWVVTVKDTPFSLQDALYSGDNAKAELILPNRTWIRIGENTQVQLFALTDDTTTLDVASGTARVYNKSRDVVSKVTTPFGYVVAPGGTVFDLYVGDESMEVIAVRGDVDVVHDATRSRYTVREGAASLIADRNGTARGNGTVDSLWDDWNGDRDRLWSRRLQSSGSTASYLPEPIQEDSYVLEEHGRWERVYYEGDYHNMWRPTRVDPGWRPFSAGRWTVYYGDNCWVPDEPFGYLTHHYGSWVYIDSFRNWYWLPPVRRVVVSTPHILPAFGWYPGRVGWIHHGKSIGWVPLAPSEDYYGYNPWGRRTVVIKRTAVPALSVIRYRYLESAVIIHRDHFYRGSRYTPHLQRDIGRAVIINNYQPVAVINNTVINNFDSNTNRFAFNDARVERKPHSMVVNRIVNNQQLVKKTEPLNRDRITQDLTQLTVAEPSSTTTQSPVLTSKLVEAKNVSKPLPVNTLPKKEIKPRERQRQLVAETDQGSQTRTQKERQGLRPERKDERQRMQAAREARNQLLEQSAAMPRQANEPPPTAPDRVAPLPNKEQPAVPSQQSQSVGTPVQQPTQQPMVAPDQRMREGQRLPVDQEKLTTPGSGANEDRPQQRPQPPGIGSGQESRQSERNLPRPQESPRSAIQQPVEQIVPPSAEPESQRRIRSPREFPAQETRRPDTETARENEQRQRISNDQQAIDQGRDPQNDQQGQRRIRSPRETRSQETEQQRPDLRPRRDEQFQRQQQEIRQRQQEDQLQRQQQETLQRQGEEQQRRQQEALQRQQEDQQRRQQEMIQRQQEEQQRRQQETLQRQQEDQQRRQQEMIQRQQEEQQRRQQEALQRQQEDQQRRQQEMIKRQQEEQQRRQQEALQRQQEEQQRRQQEMIQRQQEEQQRRQQQPQQRKKTPQEEELLQQQGQPR